MSFPLPSDHDELDVLWAREDGSICFICSEFETFDGVDPFEVCFECGHVYRTADEMIYEYTSNGQDDYGPDVSVEEIPFCPLCLHDW